MISFLSAVFGVFLLRLRLFFLGVIIDIGVDGGSCVGIIVSSEDWVCKTGGVGVNVVTALRH